MRALPLTALLLLGACANSGGFGQAGGLRGVDAATAALRDGLPQVALQIDDAILAKDPRNVAALISRGDAQTLLQQSNPAAASYSEALRADPSSVLARIGLGRVRLATDPAAAEALFFEASQREPRNAVAWNDLGIARDLIGRHEEAQAAYQQAMGLDASMTGAQANLGRSLAMTGHGSDIAPRLASASAAPRGTNHTPAAALAMGGSQGEAQHPVAPQFTQDKPTDHALSIFTAVGASSAPARASDAPTDLSAVLAGGSLSGKWSNAGLANVGLASAKPAGADATVQSSGVTYSAEAATGRKRVRETAAKLPLASRPVATANSGSPVAPATAARRPAMMTASADAWMRGHDKAGLPRPGASGKVPTRPILALAGGTAGGADIRTNQGAVSLPGASSAVRGGIQLDAEHLTGGKPASASRPLGIAAAALGAAMTLAPTTDTAAVHGPATTAQQLQAAIAAALPATAVPQSGAPQSGAPQSGAPQSGAPQSGAQQSGIVPASTPDATHPRDHSVLADALSPGMRAVAVGVDEISGTAGLISPGDRLDVILTQVMPSDAAPMGYRVAADTVLANVRVIAVDQQLVRGAAPGNSGQPVRVVTLELSGEQVERVAVATRLGRLSLAVRSAEAAYQPAEPPLARPTVWASDVSPALAAEGTLYANRGVRVFPGTAAGKAFQF